MKNIFRIAAFVILGSLSAAATTSVYEYPHLHPRHAQLRAALTDAIRRGDIPAMEKAARAGVELIPDDPLWHYNLACALAYRATPDLALDELRKAVDLGYREADAIAVDTDLRRIASDPRFKQILSRARALGSTPTPGQPLRIPAPVTAGSSVTLGEANITWNFDAAAFEALLSLVPPPAGAAPADAARRLADNDPNRAKDPVFGPVTPLLAAWLSGGTAAGNFGDLYMNRDGGHSLLDASLFPFLTSVRLEDAARQRGLDRMLPNMLFPNPVFGNASLALTSGPFQRSLARLALTEPSDAFHMQLFYLNNQFWVFPAVKDIAADGVSDDQFPAAAPFFLASVGASWSDQAFLKAALAASAAFRPDTKQALVRRHLLAPTLQMLFRRSLRSAPGDAAYLTAAAHPTAFRASDLDVTGLVSRAHALAPDAIPPAVGLAFVNSRLFPIKVPQPGRDYPDPNPEPLFVTPFASCVVLRDTAATRTFLLHARTLPEDDPLATFTWAVTHGPTNAVKISAPLGESLADPARGDIQVVIDRRALTNRIDIACFARTHGTSWGAPSFVSFYPVPQETRVYRPDGKIESIDYTDLSGRYSDPAISLPRRWKDTYTYSKDGAPTGFIRSYNGQPTATFTVTGERVVSTNPDGSPLKTVPVRYVPRETGIPNRPPELTYVDAEPSEK